MSFDFLTNVNAKFVGLAPHTLESNLGDFIKNNKDVEMPDAAYLWLFYSVAVAMGAKLPLKGELFVAKGTVGGQEVDFSLSDIPAGLEDSKVKGYVGPEMAAILSSNIQPMAALVFQLVGCHQIKPLKAANLKGYHASMGGLAPFDDELLALGYVSSLMDHVASDSRFIDLRARVKFLKYHSTATSSPALVLEAYNAMPSFLQPMISEEAVNAAKAAVKEFDSLEAASDIPSLALATAWLWFEATGQDRGGEKWYQGKKAVDELAPHILIKLRAAMKLYIKSQKAIGDDESAADLIRGLYE